MSEIKGRIPSNEINDERYIMINSISKENLKKIMISMINTISCLHSNGIIYSDEIMRNVIIMDDYNISLVDFGACFFKNNPPMSVRSSTDPMECVDVFWILNVLCFQLKMKFPENWKNMNITELLDLSMLIDK